MCLYLDDDEVGDAVDFDVLGKAEEECENPGEDHSQGQEVA